jgi:hypothetical protein
MATDVSGEPRNRETGRGEIAIWDCDIAAILLRICALLEGTATARTEAV